MDGWQLLRGCVGLTVTLFSSLVMAIPKAFLTLLLVMALDAVFGGLRAKSKRSKRKWDWNKSYQGFTRKIGAICVVLLAGLLEQHVDVHSVPKGALLTGAACFYIYHYSLSFLNTLGAMGVPTPKVLRVALGKFSGDEETGGEDLVPARQKDGGAA